jgi:hypothetical protein
MMPYEFNIDAWIRMPIKMSVAVTLTEAIRSFIAAKGTIAPDMPTDDFLSLIAFNNELSKFLATQQAG